MLKKPKILVVGSFVKDLIVSTNRFPEVGETVLGTNFQTASGGKGANQAAQAALLGADVTMVGKVGRDAFGQEMLDSSAECGIDCRYVMIEDNISSSIGNVQLQVGKNGKTDNRIIVVPGANMCITKEDVAFLKDEIANYDIVLLQLEIPMEINEIVAKYAYDKGVPVMLNSAPSAPLSEELISHLTYISPNEYEAADLTGVEIRRKGNEVNEDDVKEAIKRLLDKGVKNVLVTLGRAGAAFGNGEEYYLSPTINDIVAVDPTGAGDSFVGAFCTAVTMGIPYETALKVANYTASLTVSKMGAQPSMPKRENVVALMAERGEGDLMAD